MLKIKDLSKKFGDFEVLKDINLNAEAGQIYGLVGSNGCGKTTLLKHIMKIYKQNKGYIYLNGEAVEENSKVMEEFYYVQDSLFFPHMYTLNKMYNYEKLIYPNISKDKFDKLVKFFNIDPNKILNKMSKGQKKQAALIMAVSTQPKVLLLDEMIDGMDAVVKRKFWNVMIEDVMERQMIVIISSHDLKEIDNICDKVGIMHDGKLIKEENLESLKNEIKRVQFAVDGDFTVEGTERFNIIKMIKMGSIYICTMTTDTEEFKKYLNNNYKVLIFDELPMNLEEIFITELGGVGYGTEDFKFE